MAEARSELPGSHGDNPTPQLPNSPSGGPSQGSTLAKTMLLTPASHPLALAWHATLPFGVA